MDIGGFLARHAPFDALDRPTLERIAGAVQVEFFAAGTVILEPSGEPAKHLYGVRAGEIEVLDGDGRLLDLRGEGESFGFLSVVSGGEPTARFRAHEDALCYLVPRDLAERVLGTPGGVSYVAGRIRSRLAGERSGEPATDLRRRPVGTLVRREPVTCEGSTSVRDAARRMADERVSCLLVPGPDGLGILTDRDLRTRVLAARRDLGTPVREVMTAPARTVPWDTMAGEVLSSMLAEGFHHFPVVDGSGARIGVVTDTDLMGLERRSPFVLKSSIERSPDVESAVEAGRLLPSVVCELVDAAADPVEVGHVVGVVVDALTGRLIELAFAEIGEPPVPWAWLALGSEARHEQALHTDQDHALAYDPGDRPDAELDGYFAGLAERVTAGLEEAGIPRCRGDAMAVTPGLRRSLDGWRRALRGWMADPGVEGSVLTSIVFDYRRVAGPLDAAAALDPVVAEAPERYPQFLRHLAHRALDHRPPTGFFRDLVVEAKGEHAGRLDVKHRGIMIITNLARAYAIRAGRNEKRTLDRLHIAAGAGQISEQSKEALDEAFRLLWRIRLEHQARQVRTAEAPDDFVDPKGLGPIARRGLKEAFSIIAAEQQALAVDVGAW
jgi:CBS domain-containing protein